jgi:hypothetical protein
LYLSLSKIDKIKRVLNGEILNCNEELLIEDDWATEKNGVFMTR